MAAIIIYVHISFLSRGYYTGKITFISFSLSSLPDRQAISNYLSYFLDLKDMGCGNEYGWSIDQDRQELAIVEGWA